MVQYQLKLKLTKSQETTLNEWLYRLTGVWNWGVRKIELDAKDGIYYSHYNFVNLLSGHSNKVEIPSHVLKGTLDNVYKSWKRCFKKLSKKPKLKGNRNKLNNIPFPDVFNSPDSNKITVLGLGKVRFHKQWIPEGKIKCGRMIKKSSGWYMCLFIDAEPKEIKRTGEGQVGIDPGFKNLLTLSNGEVIKHPRELEESERRLAQAQRGRNKKLSALINEKVANKRKDRNHKLSRRLVSENVLIAFSADNHKGIAGKFGKSVTSSSHYQLRRMLSYKSTKSGTKYVEVEPKFSTMTCSVCGARTGPHGWSGLAVRRWRCSVCGTDHNRDVNAAMVVLNAAVGTTVEMAA